MRLVIPHYKIWQWEIKKSYLRRCILFNKIVCFSSMVFFPALIFCLFLLKWSDAGLYSLPLVIFEPQKWCIEKDKTPEAAYLLKVSNNDTTGIVESYSKWKYVWRSFCACIWWLRGSVTIYPFPCHLWVLLAYETFHSFQHCFYNVSI